ncbi:S-adenosyl-L-methionine-dependent methyltransferase [Peziza echinospora]|nr:S-adenosyl-L-methionine-dependent methyltransferase [Peziza echinospora]
MSRSSKEMPSVDFGVLPYSSNTLPYGSPARTTPLSILNSLPPHQRLNLVMAEAFARKMEWTGVQWNDEKSTVLDCSCNPGLMSQIIAPYVKHVTGVDPSDATINEYNRRAANQRLYPNKVRGFPGDLSTYNPDPRLEYSEFYNFDLAIIGPGFHISNYPQVILMHIYRRLKSGGIILIMDYESPYQGYSSVPSQSRHYGYTRGELQALLEQQGLADVYVEALTDSEGNSILDEGGQRQLVLAKGVKKGWQA